VTVNSILAGGGDAYLELGGERERVDDRVPLREVLEQAFASQKAITPPTDNRYRRQKR
jgi:hypothetical protein